MSSRLMSMGDTMTAADMPASPVTRPAPRPATMQTMMVVSTTHPRYTKKMTYTLMMMT